MKLLTSDNLGDFELLDTGAGYRLEQWGRFRLARPDPQIIWQKHMEEKEWERAHAVFSDEQRNWNSNSLPKSWEVNLVGIKMLARLSPFKHTGIFPEQAANWQWMAQRNLNPKS